MTRAPSIILMLALECAACTALDLGDFNLEACTETSQGSPCEILNRRRGVLDSACLRYQCRRHGLGCELRPKDSDDDGQPDQAVCSGQLAGPLDCDDTTAVRRPGADEICDGLDNDCDGAIDEQLPPEPASEVFAFESGERLRSLSATQAPGDDVFIVASEQHEEATALRLLVLDHAELKPRTERAHDLNVSLADHSAVIGSGACLKQRDGQLYGSASDFADFRLAAGGGCLFATGIDTLDSAFGVLRAGPVLSAEPAYEVQLGSRGHNSQIECGLETGSSAQPASLRGAQLLNLAAPAVRSSEQVAEALLVWRGLAVRTDGAACPRACATCGSSAPAAHSCGAVDAQGCGGATAVSVLGLVADVADDGSASIDALGEPEGAAIGSSAGSTPAAIVSWGEPPDGGYLVAYAGEHAVELWSRPQLVGCSPERAAAATLRGSVHSPEPVDAVALAVSPAPSPGQAAQIGSVWRSGCDEHTSIAFAVISLDAAAGAWVAQATTLLRRDVRVVAGPILAYSPSGYRQSQDATRAGGWVVLWLEATSTQDAQLMMARVAEADTRAPEPARTLASGSIGFPFLFENQRKDIRYGYVDTSNPDSITLQTGTTRCGATDSAQHATPDSQANNAAMH